MAKPYPDLLCSEKDSGLSETAEPADELDCRYAACDLSILQDHRVLDRMLLLQMTTLPTDKYLNDPMADIKPRMRKIVVKWMLEICDEQRCEDQVFLVAVNLLDRFLNAIRVNRTQLQLIACVCLLLASKLRQSSYLSVSLLSYYTDDAVTEEEVRQWEILITGKLKWDLCPLTPVDFVDVLLQQMHTVPKLEKVRDHSRTLIALTATERKFIPVRPSHIAGGAILAAIMGMQLQSSSLPTDIIDDLSQKLKIPDEILVNTCFSIENSMKIACKSQHDVMDAFDSGHSAEQSKLEEMAEHEEMMLTNGKETPVDVMDVIL